MTWVAIVIPPFTESMIWSVEPVRLLPSSLSSAKTTARWPSWENSTASALASRSSFTTDVSWPERCTKVGLLSFPLFNLLDVANLLDSDPPWAYLLVKDEDMPGSIPITMQTVSSTVVRTRILFMLFWTSVASRMMRMMLTIIAIIAKL